MTSEEILKKAEQFLLNTYNRPSFVLEKGEGVWLIDKEGKRYLDFISGLGVNALGYDYDFLSAIVREQGQKLIHCSNLFHNESGVKLAQLLVENSFADKVFLCNSGAEAVEGAIKFARRWGNTMFNPPRNKILCFEGSFHGRTLGALSATARGKYQQGYEPLLPGFAFVPFNCLHEVEKTLTADYCAVLLEPIQGEGGINVAAVEFLRGVRRICDQKDLLLILDEVQCGLGRTGNLFAYQAYDILPDILTLAKPLGGGLPIGAILTTEKVAESITPGTHGSTFGGNPFVCAVAAVVFERLQGENFLAEVRQKGRYLHSKLESLHRKYPSVIKEIRGKGLMLGMELEVEGKTIVEECAKNGLLICLAGEKVLRFLPPLIVKKEHIDQAVEILDRILMDIP